MNIVTDISNYRVLTAVVDIACQKFLEKFISWDYFEVPLNYPLNSFLFINKFKTIFILMVNKILWLLLIYETNHSIRAQSLLAKQ